MSSVTVRKRRSGARKSGMAHENMSDNQASMDELADELDALDFSF